MNDNYEYSFQERVVRLSVVAAIIVGIVCIIGWGLFHDDYEGARRFVNKSMF